MAEKLLARLLDREIAGLKFPGYFWMGCGQCDHVSQMNRNPARVVGVVHRMEPCRQLSQGVQVHLEGSLAQGANIHQNRQLNLQDGCPVVELGARLCSLLAPIIKFQLLIAFITQLKVAVVVPPLQCRQCCCCDLMCPPGSTDMGCPQGGVRCPGTSDLCLNQRLHPPASLQPVTQGLKCCYLNMKTAEDDDKLLFTILLWPLPLNLLCQSKHRLVEYDDWSLARVEMLHRVPNHIHGVLDHSHCVILGLLYVQ